MGMTLNRVNGNDVYTIVMERSAYRRQGWGEENYSTTKEGGL